MADKEKKVAQDSKVDKATTEESKAAEKVAKAAKGSKNNKPNFFARVLLGFFVESVFLAESAVLIHLQPIRIVLLVFHCVVITLFALCAR